MKSQCLALSVLFHKWQAAAELLELLFFVKVGRLALQQRRILFEYDPAFVAYGIEISPLKLR